MACWATACAPPWAASATSFASRACGVVERSTQTLRLGEQFGDGVQGVGHEGRRLVEASVVEQLEQAEQAEQLRHRPGEERRRVELAGVERRRRVAALADRAERAGDALDGQVGGDEATGAVGALGEVDGRRRRS